MADVVPPGGPSRPAPRVCEGYAREVADWFLDGRSRPRDARVRLAYRMLERQTDRVYRHLTCGCPATRTRVVFTRCGSPYGSDSEMVGAVRTTRLLEVTTVGTERGRLHPVLGNEPGGAYDRFRAVHDLTGHVATGWGFDRDGEYGAWLSQDRWHRGLACLALATELHAEHSVRWTTGDVAEHKALLLDPRLLARAKEPSLTALAAPAGC